MSHQMSESMPGLRRKPWQAALLSLLLPGLGQVYNGQAKKGILLYCLLWVVVLACFVIVMELSLPPFNVVVPLLILLLMDLYIVIDAIRVARRQGDTFPRKVYNRCYVYLIALAIFIFGVGPIVSQTMKRVVMQAFKIPSGAMATTLLIGDHILVNKFSYHLTSPKRFDIIVFTHPWDEDRTFIKRVIALPGDRVQVRNRQVYVNEQPLQEPYAQYTATQLWEGNFGPVVVPQKGDIIEIRSDKHLYLNGEALPIPPGSYDPRDHGAAMTGFEVFYGPLFPAGATLRRPTGPLVVQHDYYFTLGDNRDNSRDSRYWGFVRDAQILGPAKRIYLSWDHHARQVRWERIGQSLR